jgi:tetratricopeptide (TPR) repeat protein
MLLAPMKSFSVAILLLGLLAQSLQAQTSPKAAMLEQAAWAALDARNVQAAADAFKEAIALDRKNARLRLGAGMAAFLQRRDADAKEALEHALVLDPQLTRARAQLAHVLRRTGDLLGAIRAYEIVVSQLPGDAGARETLERWRREFELHERMRLEVGDHFLVSFEGPEDAALAAQAVEALERAYWRVCDLLGAFPTAPIPVILYSNEQFRDITRSPPWAAGVYDGRIRVPVRGARSDPKELERVLGHEFVHALIRSLADRNVPAWLNEGLATALEDDGVEWAARQIRKAKQVPSLAVLQTAFGRLAGAEAQAAYATSALAAQRLLDDVGGTAVANLLRDIGEGIEFEKAFEHRMQRSFADFQAALGAQ